jgi:sRNA-binding carbon storage regulator CsrA
MGALTLERKEGQAVVLETSSGNIRVSFSHLRSTRIKIHIEAPQAVKILREELITEPGSDSAS